jgi:toxin ParE1/3/4
MRIVRRRGARQDLISIYRHYAREAGVRVADRFYAAAEATFTRLAKSPGLGARYHPDHPALAGLRYSTVSRFKNYLVFYRPIGGGIEILRVLHGARDVPSILAEEFGIEDDAGDEASDEEEN